MSHQKFSVSYNGHPTTVTCLGYNTFMVQITYKPVYIKLQKALEGTEKWVDKETNMETPLTLQMGKLIKEQLSGVDVERVICFKLSSLKISRTFIGRYAPARLCLERISSKIV